MRLGILFVTLGLAWPLRGDDYYESQLRAQAAIRAQQQRNYESQLRAEAAIRAQQQRNYESQLRAEAAVRAQQQRNYEAQLRAEAAIRAQNQRNYEAQLQNRSYYSPSYTPSYAQSPSPSYSSSNRSYTYPGGIPYHSSPPVIIQQPEYEVIPRPEPQAIVQRQETKGTKTSLRIRVPEGATLYIAGEKKEGNVFYTIHLENGQQYYYVVEVELTHQGKKYRKGFELAFKGGERVDTEVTLADVVGPNVAGTAPTTPDPQAKFPALPKKDPTLEEDGWLAIPPGVVAIGGKRVQKGADGYRLNPDGSVTWRTPFAKNLREWETGANSSAQKLLASAKSLVDEDERVDTAYFKGEREIAAKIGDTALEELAESLIAAEEKKRKEFRSKILEAQTALSTEQLAAILLEAKATADEGPEKEEDHLKRSKSLEEKWDTSWKAFASQWSTEKTRRADQYRPMVDAAEASKRYLEWEKRSNEQDQAWFDAAKKKHISDTETADEEYFEKEKERIEKLPTAELRQSAGEALEKERTARRNFRERALERLTKDLEKRRKFTRAELLAVLGGYFRREANFHEAHKLRFADESKRLEKFETESDGQLAEEQKRQKQEYRSAQNILDSLKPEEVSLPTDCKSYAVRDDKNGTFAVLHIADEKKTAVAKITAKSARLACKDRALAILVDALSAENDFVQLENGDSWDNKEFAEAKTGGRLAVFDDGKLVFIWDASPLQTQRVDWDQESERFILRLQKDEKDFTDHMYEIRGDGSGFKQVPWAAAK